MLHNLDFGVAWDFVRVIWALRTMESALLDTLSVKEVFERKNVSPEAQAFAYAVMGVWTGAKPESRASAILGSSLSIVLLSMLQGTWKEEAVRWTLFGGANNQLYAMYPTGECLIDPFLAGLRERGVQLRLGVCVKEVLRDVDAEGVARCSGLILCDSASGAELPRVEADAYVLAVDVAAAQRLVPESFSVSDYRMRGEWSVGCCFHLDGEQDIPFFMLPALTPCGRPRMVLNSPWHVTYTLVRVGPTRAAQNAERLTLLITASNLEGTPGRIFRKPGLHCTPDELKAEYLEQVGFGTNSAQEVALRGVMGMGVEYVDQAKLNAEPWRYVNHAHGPIQDAEGHRWISTALLYIETPDASHVFPSTCMCNLFLAGEFISSRCTNIKVPTMEKSAETGIIASREVIKHFAIVDGSSGAVS